MVPEPATWLGLNILTARQVHEPNTMSPGKLSCCTSGTFLYSRTTWQRKRAIATNLIIGSEQVRRLLRCINSIDQRFKRLELVPSKLAIRTQICWQFAKRAFCVAPRTERPNWRVTDPASLDKLHRIPSHDRVSLNQYGSRPSHFSATSA